MARNTKNTTNQTTNNQNCTNNTNNTNKKATGAQNRTGENKASQNKQ